MQTRLTVVENLMDHQGQETLEAAAAEAIAATLRRMGWQEDDASPLTASEAEMVSTMVEAALRAAYPDSQWWWGAFPCRNLVNARPLCPAHAAEAEEAYAAGRAFPDLPEVAADAEHECSDCSRQSEG